MDGVLFPFAETWGVYLAFLTMVVGLLALDLGVFHRQARAVSFKEAAGWTAVWVSLGCLFGGGLYFWALDRLSNHPELMSLPGFSAEAEAARLTMEYYAGFVIEKALAADNIFVFAMAFSWFAVKPEHQHRILFYGILGALVFRAIFIAMGSILMQFHWVVVLAGLFLVFTGLKMAFSEETVQDPEKNLMIRLLKKVLPVTSEQEGDRFFIVRNGVRYGTPLLVALVFIEACDIVFAVDSVPAIFAVTKEPLIVFTSNIFAILGLRSMYFMLASVLHQFHLLKYGLSAILVFVGLKMSYLNGVFGGKFPIGLSLGIIGFLLVTSIVASRIFPKADTAPVA